MNSAVCSSMTKFISKLALALSEKLSDGVRLLLIVPAVYVLSSLVLYLLCSSCHTECLELLFGYGRVEC